MSITAQRDAFEYKQYKRILSLMMGVHFTQEEVARIKWLLAATEIVDKNYERDLSELSQEERYA